MPRRTVPHDRCEPFVVRDRDRLELVMPVIRPTGRIDTLKARISPTQAAHIAGELMAFVSASLAVSERHGNSTSAAEAPPVSD